MKNMRQRFTVFFSQTITLLFSFQVALAAENQPAAEPPPAIELGSPFRDSAILQREMALRVWGWSKPGNTITVEFAGQKEAATVGANGKWSLKLKPLQANSVPTELLVSDSDGKKVVL